MLIERIVCPREQSLNTTLLFLTNFLITKQCLHHFYGSSIIFSILLKIVTHGNTDDVKFVVIRLTSQV